jgi:hypothetical protein
MAAVYKKTAKGQSEIETRANRLVPRLRSALILVDGRRTDEELRTLIPAQADEALAVLEDQGYIELIAQAPPAASRAKPAAPAQSDPLSPARLDETRRLAVRFLTDQLGPAAEPLAIKIERSKDWAELTTQLEMAEHFLRAGRGVALAQEFADKFLQPPAP